MTKKKQKIISSVMGIASLTVSILCLVFYFLAFKDSYGGVGFIILAAWNAHLSLSFIDLPFK